MAARSSRVQARFGPQARWMPVHELNKRYVLSVLNKHHFKVIPRPSNAVLADRNALLETLQRHVDKKNLAGKGVSYVILPKDVKGNLFNDLKYLQLGGGIGNVRLIYEKAVSIDRKSTFWDLGFEPTNEEAMTLDAETLESMRPFVLFELADDEAMAESRFDINHHPQILQFHPRSPFKPY